MTAITDTRAPGVPGRAVGTPAPGDAGARHHDGSPARGFRPDIEGLRAIAVVLVALEHAGFAAFGGGFVGVDVFFVISGFLITGLLVDETARRGRPSISRFYARRVRRILPLSALVTVMTVLAAYAVGGAAIGNRAANDGAWASVFLANVHFADAGIDYFERGGLTSPLQHYWSLGVEEQFYLVWPLLVVVAALAVRREAAMRRTLLILMLTGIALVSLWYSLFLTVSSPTAAYFSPFTRAWELAAGALLAVTLRGARPLSRMLGAEAALLGLVMVGGAVVLFDASTPFPGVAAVLPVLGTVVVVAGGILGPTNPVTLLLGSAPMRFVGERSYGFYLWHFPFLVLPALKYDDIPWWGSLLLVLAAFGVACLTYTLVENPVRHSEWLAVRPTRATLAVGAGLVAASLVAALGLQAVNRTDYRPDEAAPVADLPAQDAIAQEVLAGTRLTSVPADLQPPLTGIAEFGSLTPAEATCDRPYETRSADLCFLGDTSSDQTIVLWGDSHASMWAPALSALAEQSGKRLAVFAKYGCAPLLGVEPWHPTDDRAYDECPDFKDSVVPLIQQLDPETIVLTGAFRGWDYVRDGQKVDGGEYTSRNQWIPDPTTTTVWDSALSRTLQALRGTGARTVVLGDIAYPRQDPSACLPTHTSDLRACETSREDGVFAEHNQAERATAEAGRAAYVDTTAWFCTDRLCPPVVHDISVYRDDYHITRQYSLYLAGALGTALGLVDDPAGPGASADASPSS